VGIPKAQGRPKFFRRGNHVGTYDPKESRHWKNNVSAQIVAQKPQFIKSGAISVIMLFHLPKPKSLSKKVLRHVKKPDIDNLQKAIFDSCKGILWGDDSQVVEIFAAKSYALEEPHVLLTVNALVECA
jgi:Holliday junction resolvase RusA-like endonuclease